MLGRPVFVVLVFDVEALVPPALRVGFLRGVINGCRI